MISLSGFWSAWAPSIQLSDYHRARLHRMGVVLAASIVAFQVAGLLVLGVAMVLR